MHVGKVYIEDNLMSNYGVMTYNYLIKPKNSLYSEKTQKSDLVELMKKLILNINMPGYFLIRPRGIDNKKILQFYLDNFEKYGHDGFRDLAGQMLFSLEKILKKHKRFRYDLYFVLCDGREELKHRKRVKMFTVDENVPYDKRMMERFKLYEKQIFKKIKQKGLDVKRVVDEKELLGLQNYLAIPTEKPVYDYYVRPDVDPSKLVYEYETMDHKKETLYSRTFVASKFNKKKISSKNYTDDVINCLQLESFPVDTIVKFDLEHTREFKKNMAGKKQDTIKKTERYTSLSDRIDKEGVKAIAIAKVGENVDESIEKSKIRWQLFFRLYSKREKNLERYSDQLRILMEGKMNLSVEYGDQLKLANNLMPYRSVFTKYTQLTDVAYFCQYNWLGGLFIGEEHEGFVETFTKPGRIPILYDISKVFEEGATGTHCSTTAYAGESGGGKTQQADNRVFTYMVFRGMRTLCVDPKGDRLKKVELLGDMASHLIIGSPDCQNGMFDAYLINENINEAYSQAKKDVDSLLRAVNMHHEGIFQKVEEAHRAMITDLQLGKIKKLSFTYLIEYKLMEIEPMVAKELLTLREDSMGRLFFSDEHTTFDEAFNLNKMYNLVTFDKIPPKREANDRFDPNRLERAVFSVVLSRVQNIINGFMKRFAGEEKQLVFDEYKVYKEIDGGEAIVEHANRQVRSWFVHLYIIAQSLSDISASILNNTGDKYVGSIRSSEEIEYIMREMGLEGNETIKDALQDRTKQEGADPDKKYVFILEDYNKRKSMVRNEMLDVFADAFSTLKVKVGEVDKKIIPKQDTLMFDNYAVESEGIYDG
ncbi:ATP-binding protein [Breznakia pachnodae]|uniref:TraG P-loop domain-containing protein n=1 Tax=Breznakia pachnodae TaxID=265178 RepID=A0ABU0E6E3_9FIRM|nr:ATP-binding protein [Breznakia pachnodae]MDQ0362472.1 hypothetical protein [Breznakia pachnodae]